MHRRPTVGVFGLTGCAGDQLAILNCEDELLGLVELIDIRDFLMAASSPDASCALDIAFVEGSVLSRRDEETLQAIRARAGILVAIGTCAVWGGVPAMAGDLDWPDAVRDVYGAGADHIDALAPRALHEVVTVDSSITGCPIEKTEFLAAVADLLNGNPPRPPTVPVCTECKMRECCCVLVDHGLPCLGPVTLGGCNARCPAHGIACVGCRGPAPDANVGAALDLLESHGVSRAMAIRKLRTFAPAATLAAAGEHP